MNVMLSLMYVAQNVATLLNQFINVRTSAIKNGRD